MSDLRLKCTKFDFRWGFQTPLGKLTVLLRLYSVYSRRLTFKGRDGGRGKEEGKGRGGVGNEGEGPAPKYFALEPPVSVSFARWRCSTREK